MDGSKHTLGLVAGYPTPAHALGTKSDYALGVYLLSGTPPSAGFAVLRLLESYVFSE